MRELRDVPKHLVEMVLNIDHTRNLELVKNVEVVLATDSSVINSILWTIYDKARELGKELIVYGVSAAGVAKVLGIKRYCMYSK